MATKIRLQRHGRKKRAFFHIVVADSRAPRDGRFIEKIGTYNPITNPATININLEKAVQWMANGAQPSDTARAILSYKGVLYKHHLQVGVRKGAITQEQADAKFAEWMTSKDARISEKRSNLEKASNSRKSDAMKAEAQKRDSITARVLAKQNSANEEVAEETQTTDSNSRKSDAMKAEAQKRDSITARVLAKQNSANEEVAEETQTTETEATAEVKENVAAEKTAASEEVVDDTVTEEPAAEETPASEEPAAEETTASEEPAAEEPVAEDSVPAEGENVE